VEYCLAEPRSGVEPRLLGAEEWRKRAFLPRLMVADESTGLNGRIKRSQEGAPSELPFNGQGPLDGPNSTTALTSMETLALGARSP
jgi:hypothetical protein